MHPHSAFRADPDGSLDAVARLGFAHLFAATAAGPMVAHAALTHHGDALRFHVARASRIAPRPDGAAPLASVTAPEGCVSPYWYRPPCVQVPTWNWGDATLAAAMAAA